MEDNSNFSKYLNIFYLYSLVKQDCKEEFMRFYQSVEGYLEEIARETSRVDVLTQIQNIISNSKNNIETKVQYREKIGEKIC